MDERLQKACDGKSESQGGMNVPELYEIARKNGYTGAKNRLELINFLCKSKPSGTGNLTAVKPKPVKPIKATIPKPVKPIKPVPKQKQKQENESLENIIVKAEQESVKLFPKDKKMQKEYVDDAIKLHLNMVIPAVPIHYKPITQELKTNCDACYKYIKSRNTIPKDMSKAVFYSNMSSFCSSCHNEISKQYNQDVIDNRKRYKKYHRGSTVSVDDIITHGTKGDYFNQTMYDGAVYWANVGGRRFGEELPSVPGK